MCSACIATGELFRPSRIKNWVLWQWWVPISSQSFVFLLPWPNKIYSSGRSATTINMNTLCGLAKLSPTLLHPCSWRWEMKSTPYTCITYKLKAWLPKTRLRILRASAKLCGWTNKLWFQAALMVVLQSSPSPTSPKLWKEFSWEEQYGES